MSLVEGFTVRRQTEEALYCMQTMTRIQTQIYTRRLKTEEDKKALKGQIKVEQSLDKTKVQCIRGFVAIVRAAHCSMLVFSISQ
jgi:predicted nuclease of restriction endonuclease-like (RecB) superfamily